MKQNKHIYPGNPTHIIKQRMHLKIFIEKNYKQKQKQKRSKMTKKLERKFLKTKNK